MPTQSASIQSNDRRAFLKRGLATAAAAQTLSLAEFSAAHNTVLAAQDSPPSKGKESSQRPVCIFAKHLQLMPWDQLARFCRDIEVDGIEATIRPHGQIEPEEAAEQMPRLRDALAETDNRMVILATNINSPQSAYANTILKTAVELGVTHYRTAYYRYDLSKPILPQLDAFARDATELAAMNRDLGITGLYQNHAGARYVGGPLWDLQQLLRDVSNGDLAVAYDVRHATVEANQSWPIDLSMIRDKVGAVYVKDYRATEGKIGNVPLGEGDVSKDLFAELRNQPLPGPVSLHMEYISHTDSKLVKASADAYRKDRKTLRHLLDV